MHLDIAYEANSPFGLQSRFGALLSTALWLRCWRRWCPAAGVDFRLVVSELLFGGDSDCGGGCSVGGGNIGGG